MYMKRKLPIILLTVLTLLSFWQFTTNVSAQQKLTLAMILTGLQTKGKTPETSTLEKRSAYITKKVLTSGVTFRLTPDIEREIRNAGASNALISAIRENGPYVAPTVTPRTTTVKPSALFKDLWIDYDAKEGTVDGLRIHVKFTVYGMKNLPSYVAIYFKGEDGNFLKDNNGKFTSSAGEVAVYRELDVGYDPGDYNDLTFFMPFSELDLEDGNHDLKMDVKLIYKAGGLIQQLTTKDFNYKQGDAVVKKGVAGAKVTRTWVDYNVTENGKKGMRLHVNCEVTGLKGIDSMISARVQKSNNDFLKNDSADYSNDEGLLRIKFDMKPGFDTTVFKDADLFLPYNEINAPKGKSTLKFDIDLNYESGELIQHLDFYEFQFDRP